MKHFWQKYKLPILCIAAFLLLLYSYFLFWFNDFFIIILFLTFGIGIIIIPILFVLIIILSVLYIRSNDNTLGLIPIGILCLMICLFLLFPPQKTKFNLDFDMNKDKRSEVVEKIKDNELKVNQDNLIDLPKKYYGVSYKNIVECYLNDDNNILIAFLYAPGFPDGEQYLFYSSNGDDLIKEDLNESFYSNIKKIDDEWYLVQFD